MWCSAWRSGTRGRATNWWGAIDRLRDKLKSELAELRQDQKYARSRHDQPLPCFPAPYSCGPIGLTGSLKPPPTPCSQPPTPVAAEDESCYHR